MAPYANTKGTVSDSELREAIAATEKRRNCTISFDLAKALLINIVKRMADDNPEKMPFKNAREAVLTELYIKDKATRSLYRGVAGSFFQPHSVHSRRAKRHTKKKSKKPPRKFVPTINLKSGQYDSGIRND